MTKITLPDPAARNRELRDLIALALPYVEDAADDPAFKAYGNGVHNLAARMRAAVEGGE